MGRVTSNARGEKILIYLDEKSKQHESLEWNAEQISPMSIGALCFFN